MIKRGIFLILFAIFSLTILGFAGSVHAAATDQVFNTLDNAANTVDNAANVVTRDDLRNDYLSREWNKFLNNTQLGKVLIDVKKTLTPANPAFNFVLGMNFEYSWAFTTTLLLFILLFAVGLILYRVIFLILIYISLFISKYDLVEGFWNFISRFFSIINLLFMLVIFLILSVTNLSRLFSNYVVDYTKNSEFWVQVLIFVALIVLIVIAFNGPSRLHKEFNDRVKEMKANYTSSLVEKQKKEMEELKKQQRKANSLREKFKRTEEKLGQHEKRITGLENKKDEEGNEEDFFEE